ncbi:RbsD/FucU family protein [Acidiphilium sp.]|uniref:RbsD/FucU family protein n=1 Tax=Acidiphilium sp. TaxID=527 RepID=UPI003D029C04
MLRGLDPLLTADLLYALCAMGHGDTITIVDANFPAATCARRLITNQGSDVTTMFRAIVSVLPVDDFLPKPLLTMQIVGDAIITPPAVAEIHEAASAIGIEPARFGTVDRQEFYQRARDSFAIVATGDRRLYANIIITKGVLPESL